MNLNLAVALIGVAVLLVLTVVVGLARAIDGNASAWRAIAAERRRAWEERQRLRQLAEHLDLCRDCPLRRL
jgi:hypothetical protein